jgi:hypothetical protein
MNTAKQILDDLCQIVDKLPVVKKKYLLFPLGSGDHPGIIEAKKNPLYFCQEDTTGTITGCIEWDMPETNEAPEFFHPYKLGSL